MANVFHPAGLAGAPEDKFATDFASTSNLGSLNYTFIDLRTSDIAAPADLQVMRDTGNYSNLQIVSPNNDIVNVPVTTAIFDAITGGVYASALGSSMAGNKKWVWIIGAGALAYWFLIKRR